MNEIENATQQCAANVAVHVPHQNGGPYYDQVFEQSYGAAYGRLTSQTLRDIQIAVPAPARIVDFGAGTGRLSIPLAERGYEVTAVDPSSAMLDGLHLNSAIAGVPVETSTSSMMDFSPTEKFDMALCVFTVLLYLQTEDELEGSIRSATESLKEGGLLFLDIPTRAVFKNPPPVRTQSVLRTVTVSPRGGDIYDYSDRATISTPAGQTQYHEQFTIRYWEPQQVLDLLAKHGFSVQADLSQQYAWTGSRYLMLKKA